MSQHDWPAAARIATRALWVAVTVLAMALATMASGGAPPAAAQGASANVSAIINSIEMRNPGLRSYQAHTVLDIRQVTFPYLHPVLEGTAYYSSPGFTVFDFPHTPSYLKGITKLESTAYAVNRWQRCYDITVDEQADTYVLHMVPKIAGQVSRVDVSVSRSDARLLRFDWSYINGNDHATLRQTYASVNGYDLVTQQQSELALHHIRAVGVSQFSDFQYNVPVPTPTPTPSDPLHQCDN